MDIKRYILIFLKKFLMAVSPTLRDRLNVKKQYSPRQYAIDYISKYGLHPEAAAVMPYAQGVGLDIGCGGNKTLPEAIGVDITPKGQKGIWGNQKDVISKADICASGDCLPCKDNSFDYVIARHNLEHYQDIIKPLLEWRRVLKSGGLLCVVVPDDDEVDGISLDPTHKHVFTQESFKRLIELLEGFEILKIDVCIPHWSFISVLKKKL